MAETLAGTLDEIFNGTYDEARAHITAWVAESEHGGANPMRCLIAELAYIAWKLSEIERKTPEEG